MKSYLYKQDTYRFVLGIEGQKPLAFIGLHLRTALPKPLIQHGCVDNTIESNILYLDKLISVYNEFKVFASRYYPDVGMVSINPVELNGIFKDNCYIIMQ